MRTPSSGGFDLWEAVEGLRENFASRTSGMGSGFMGSGFMGAGPMGSGRMGPMNRGDNIRAAILTALLNEPMNGYQIIRAIETRTNGTFKPTPGAIYPTLQLLTDEGLVSSEQVGERKVYSLTDAGKVSAAEVSGDSTPWESRRSWNMDRSTALPKSGAKLAQAAAQVAQSGSREQTDRAVAIIDEARRKLYAILAED